MDRAVHIRPRCGHGVLLRVVRLDGRADRSRVRRLRQPVQGRGERRRLHAERRSTEPERHVDDLPRGEGRNGDLCCRPRRGRPGAPRGHASHGTRHHGPGRRPQRCRDRRVAARHPPGVRPPRRGRIARLVRAALEGLRPVGRLLRRRLRMGHRGDERPARVPVHHARARRRPARRRDGRNGVPRGDAVALVDVHPDGGHRRHVRESSGARRHGGITTPRHPLRPPRRHRRSGRSELQGPRPEPRRPVTGRGAFSTVGP